MKKIFLILSSLALMTSCVVNTSTNQKRTPRNLAFFMGQQYESTVGVCLNLIASGSVSSELILDDQVSVTVTSLTNSSVHLEGKGPKVEFSFDALCRPGSYGRDAFVLSDLSFVYNEANGHVLEMRFSGDMIYDWVEKSSATFVSYSLVPSGVLMGDFYLNSKQVDYCKLVYDCGEIQFYTSVSW